MANIIGTDGREYTPEVIASMHIEVRWELFPICFDYNLWTVCSAGFYDHTMCEECGRMVHVSSYIYRYYPEARYPAPITKLMAVCTDCRFSVPRI